MLKYFVSNKSTFYLIEFTVVFSQITQVINQEFNGSLSKGSQIVKVYPGGLFHWLSTNGGRELKNRINSTRFFKALRISTSDAKINNQPLHLSGLIFQEDIDENADNMAQVSSHCGLHIDAHGLRNCVIATLNQPWIFIDTGVMLETSHYSLRVPVTSDQWPLLQHQRLVVRC